MTTDRITVNRAPVLTLWAAIVAERLGYDHETALTLGRAVAGLNAQSKGRSLGIFHPSEGEGNGEDEARERPAAEDQIPLMGRRVPVVQTERGLRATAKGAQADPAGVTRYLETKFKADLPAVTEALQALAASLPSERLAEDAYALYERFRPAIPRGKAGWGAAGELDLESIRRLVRSAGG